MAKDSARLSSRGSLGFEYKRVMSKAMAREQIALAVRNAPSWNEIEQIFSAWGFALLPGIDDIYALNFDTEQIIYLSECGHFLPFLVERLGPPPAPLRPRNYNLVIKSASRPLDMELGIVRQHD